MVLGEGFCSYIQTSIHHTRTVVLPLDCLPGTRKKRGERMERTTPVAPPSQSNPLVSSFSPSLSLRHVSQLFNTISFNESEDFI